MKQKVKTASTKMHWVEHINRRTFIIAAALVGLIAIVAGILWFYNGRALPNVTVGRTQLGSATVADIKRAVVRESNIKLTLIHGDSQRSAPLKKLGVKVDVDATVEQVLKARRSNNLLQDMQVWRTQAVPLVFTNDPGVLKKFIQKNYPKLFVDAKDAKLVYDGAKKQFVIVPGTSGKGFDIKKFESSLPDLALNPRDVTLKVATSPVQPLIQAKGLIPVRKEVNKRIHLAIRFVLDGGTIHRLSPTEIAGWAHFMPDVVKGTVNLEFDKAKIKQFITNVVSPTVARPPIDRKVVIDKETGTKNVLAEGQKGWEIANADDLASNVLSAVTDGKSLNQQVTINEAPFKTVTMTGSGKWVEVDLSNQTTNLYIGDTLVHSFLISSGTDRTPTQVGEGMIYAKHPVTTMTGTMVGEYYYVPNVKWVSFFNGGEAFHGTYWHSNFGQPMSHGCINMTEADAKVLYDFAPIGTRVIVHY